MGQHFLALGAGFVLGLPLGVALLIAAAVWSGKAVAQRRKQPDDTAIWRRRRSWGLSLVGGALFLGSLSVGSMLPFGVVAVAMMLAAGWMFWRMQRP